MLHALTNPDYFTLLGPQGTPVRGADQMWFPRAWQRMAGCGPTTAATILAYLAHVHPDLASLAPAGRAVSEDFVRYMDTLWRYATPGPRGLDKPENFILGCRSFALSRGCRLTGTCLRIPRARTDRPDRDTVRDFLAQALDDDCPVAFLNYANGGLSNLDSWHWVPLISLTEGDSVLLCSILDEGQEKIIDLAQWLPATKLGGALVVLSPNH